MRKAIVITLVCLALAVILLYPGSGLTVTVQATVRVPVSDTHGVSGDGRYADIEIMADSRAFISEGEHGAPYRWAFMPNGTLVTGLGYGPIAVKGSVSASALRKACPGLPLDKDWEFTLGMFNTSDGRKVRIYLELEIRADTLSARSVMHLYYDGYAHPVIEEREVEIGEDFGFGVEI